MHKRWLAGEAERLNAKAAFISTPSLFFSIPKATRKKLGCVVLDYDRKWEKEDGLYFYDFNKPAEIAEELAHQFDLVVIDPPFITREVPYTPPLFDTPGLPHNQHSCPQPNVCGRCGSNARS